MFLIPSEDALIAAFRPRDQRQLEAPTGASYPLRAREWFSWVESTGIRAYVIFPHESGKLLGIAFRRDQDPSNMGSGLCDWCHSVGDDIGLLGAEKSSKRRVGVWLCRDLNCADKLDDAANRAGNSSVEPKRRQLERMRQFAREALGIQHVP
jgi:hypothetical protein